MIFGKKTMKTFLINSKKSTIFRQFVSLVLVVFLSQLLLQWFQNDLNIARVFDFVFSWHTEKFLISWAVMMIPALWLWAVIGNIKMVEVIYLVVSAVMGYITYEKMGQRGEPFYPSDFRMATDLPFLLEMIPPFVLVLLIISLVASVLFLFLRLKKKRKKKLGVHLNWKWRMGMFLFTTLMMTYLVHFQAEGNLIKKAYDRTAYWIPYSQQMNYYNNGFVAGFLYNFSSSPMEIPDDFSKVGIAQITEKYQKKADEINQSRVNEKVNANVIYIMNESFADPFDLIEMNKEWDPIPYTREVAKAGRSGKMLSQGYGGGTANIEFEALTGFSMEPFSPTITTPFTQFLPKETNLPSVVSRLKADGHVTTAIHPFDTSMYKRRDNYENLGFDHFYYNATMKHTSKIENNPYISDEAAYQEVLYRMKETEEYDFVHLVTMQNHTPYSGQYDTAPAGAETGFYEDAPNQYLRDLQYSDEAMKHLTDELEKIDEPTIVVFWGDHWPNVFGESVLEKNGEETLHHTPVIIFSNQKTDSKDLQVISPIYFFNEVLSIANAKVTPFEAFLLELREKIPAFEKAMYFEKEAGQYIQSRDGLDKETQKMLEEYDWVMYDCTVGEKLSVQQGFFE